jgi:hypothetical protein
MTAGAPERRTGLRQMHDHLDPLHLGPRGGHRYPARPSKSPGSQRDPGFPGLSDGVCNRA